MTRAVFLLIAALLAACADPATTSSEGPMETPPVADLGPAPDADRSPSPDAVPVDRGPAGSLRPAPV